jgi:hypothetical protein
MSYVLATGNSSWVGFFFLICSAHYTLCRLSACKCVLVCFDLAYVFCAPTFVSDDYPVSGILRVLMCECVALCAGDKGKATLLVRFHYSGPDTATE